MADIDCLVSRRPVVSSADSICSACWCASEICYVVRETVDRVCGSFARNVGWFLKYCGLLWLFFDGCIPYSGGSRILKTGVSVCM